MLGVEDRILNTIKELRVADTETLRRKIAMSPEYIDEVCAGLIKDRYISKKPKGYVLTQEGQKAISPVKVRGPIAVLKGGL